MKYSSFPQTRTRIIFFVVLIFSLILIGKLFLLQVVNKNEYRERADRQYFTPSSNIFERGSIFFERKDGELISAATQTTGYKLTINPQKIKDKDEIFKKLSEVIKLDTAQFTEKSERKNDPYEEIANRLTKEEADQITAMKIPGISIYKDKWRFYPGEGLASHVLGFVAYKGDDFSGRYGLEKKFNDELSRDKENPYVNFFAEVFSNISKSIWSGEKKEGDVITTIEPSVQGTLESTLRNVAEKYQADSLGGIIMSPIDGSIYALGSLPDFDPNNFQKVKNVSVFGNPIVESVFEFGSVVKPLVMAGALDAGVVTASTKYDDYGSVIVEKKEIFNFDRKGRGPGVTMQEVLSQSLNTGMVFVERKMGKERLREYLLSFGIKDKTGIDLPNEIKGLVSNILSDDREIEFANAAFGQGIALTPIALTRALASLSNGGNLVTPHVVKKIRYADGGEKELFYASTKAKISSSTSTEISRMLVNAGDKNLGGRLKHWSIAAKTGTAQVANNEKGGYYEDRHIHSFFGYFPAYDPKFIIFLYAVNPKNVRYAIETWSSPFLDITNFLINYYEIPPDR